MFASKRVTLEGRALNKKEILEYLNKSKKNHKWNARIETEL
jgi:hypothetical protein